MDEEQQQRQHAAEQLIMQTVMHHKDKGGIQAWNISNITRIDRDLVDVAVRELIRRKEVMLKREVMNSFILPYKELPPKVFSRMGRPRKEDVEAAAAVSVPVKVRDNAIRTNPSGSLECNCPACRKLLVSTQKRWNLITQLKTHMVGMHGYTRESASVRLEELGLIGGRYASESQGTTSTVQEAA